MSGGEQVASAEKIVEKMKRQPNGIRMDEADKVLRHFGYRFDRQKGSHRHYIDESGDVLTIPERTPTIKSFYVNEILSRIGE
jgi:predicted RNA binding protein YcfA (HicA-like mRNA interferase family)